MKIIGKTSNSEFIIVAADSELAMICGFSYSSSMPEKLRPDIGREIKVASLYAALCVSRARKADIAGLANSLRTVAGRIDSINRALAEPIVEVEVQAK